MAIGARRRGASRCVAAITLTVAVFFTIASSVDGTTVTASEGARATPPPSLMNAGAGELGEGFYPRVVRARTGQPPRTLTVATFQRGGEGLVYRGRRDGSFVQRSTIPAATAVGSELCCTTLFALPARVARSRADVLLWAGSITETQEPLTMRLGIWRSDDGGSTWHPLGDCARGDGGLWEPVFLVANDGSLVCIYSDETDPAHSQVLSLAISRDGGKTFAAPRQIVALQPSGLRPGMPTVVQLPDGTWRMTYEICNSTPHCEVRIRSSTDGIDWDDPAWSGFPVIAADGSYFTHTPVLAWSSSGGAAGTLLLVGQIYHGADGAPAPGNGSTVLMNRKGGIGPWQPLSAPVAVPSPFDHYCPNYSSALLPLNRTTLLEFATTWDGTICTVHYARGPLPPA